LLDTSPKVEERRRKNLRSFFMLDFFTWLADPRASVNQSELTSKQAYERCLPHTFHRLALESQPDAWLPGLGGRVGRTNKQASYSADWPLVLCRTIKVNCS
jgi:hypothetical protein